MYAPQCINKINTMEQMANQYSQSRVNRLKAIENGEKKYLSVTACKTCGLYERYVCNNSCAQCTIKSGLEKLNNKELMGQYRTKEKKQKYCENNKEKVNQIKRKYAKSERGKAVNCEKQRRRYARLKQGIPIEINENELRKIQEIYQDAQHLTSTTGIRYDVDHIIPLFEGGEHHPDNLQIITYTEHLIKTAQENIRRQQK